MTKGKGHGAQDLIVAHGQRPAQTRPIDGKGQVARPWGHQGITEAGAVRHPCDGLTGRQTVCMVGKALRLNHIERRSGRQGLKGQTNTAQQATTGCGAKQKISGHTHGVKVLRRFQTDRSLPSHDVKIIKGGHDHCTAILSDLSGYGLAALGEAVIEHHLCAIANRGLSFDRGCIRRHDDESGHAQFTRGIGNALGMVARREGNNASLALIHIKTAEAIIGPAKLERAGSLQNLGLDPHRATAGLVQGGAGNDGRDNSLPR